MRRLFLMLVAVLLLSGVAAETQVVVASYYANSLHGKKTASGTLYNKYEMTCAHKTLPFGTILKVRNPKNDSVVYVKVTDRGPFIKGRSIDLSYAAARELDMIGRGVIRVEISKYISET